MRGESGGGRFMDRRWGLTTSRCWMRLPGIRGAVTFNSSCYILGIIWKRAEARDLAGGLWFDWPRCAVTTTGYVQQLIAQRPELKAITGWRLWSRLLLFDERPQVVNLLPIDILLKENYQFYNKIIQFIANLIIMANELFNVARQVVVMTGEPVCWEKVFPSIWLHKVQKMVVLDRGEEAGKALVDEIVAQGTWSYLPLYWT